MRISEREPGDVARLEELIACERHADKRDRYRVALLALRGHEKLEIAELLGMAKSTVEYWAYAYRDRGIDALRGRARRGGAPKIRGENAQRLKQRIDAGPREDDGVCCAIALLNCNKQKAATTVYRTFHLL